MIPSLTNHLWQTTLFAGLAALLTLALRKNRAQARWWVWQAASVKFLFPFSLLVTIGGRVGWRTAPLAPPPPVTVVMEALARPFAASASVAAAAKPTMDPVPILFALWMTGFAVFMVRWLVRWQRIRAAMREARPAAITAPIPVELSRAPLEPGVFGIFRPVLLLPEGIAERLSAGQLRSILAHELCHVRRRDNFWAALHMVVEAVFWFHPLVWWIGRRLLEERERACDEEVCSGCEPEVYAEAILHVCKYYAESPLACTAGVTGANLKRRIEEIMTRRSAHRLDAGKRLMLAAAAAAAIALPVAIGIWNAPPIRAQTTERRNFAVAAIKPSEERRFMTVMPHAGGRLTANAPVRLLMQNAYGLQAFQIVGGPGWIDTDYYKIEAKAEGDATRSQTFAMLQGLLADRFQLKVHKEAKEMPVYLLEPARGGAKLPAPAEGVCTEAEPNGPPPPPPPPGQRFSPPCGHLGIMASPTGIRMQGGKIPMPELTRMLAVVLGKAVVDKTGHTGAFDVNLEFTPDQSLAGFPSTGWKPVEAAGTPSAAEPTGPTVFAALQERLGLKLASSRGPVEILVIDHIERPSGN